MGTHHLQASFNGAQISRRLQARADLGIYGIAVQEMTNMVGAIDGAAVKRPGTWYRAAALATAARLTPFVFNATQAYVIEWSDAVLRFVTNDALVMDGPDPLEVVVPYSAAEAARVSYEQSGDVLYLAHGSHQQAALSRTAADAFTYAAIDLVGGPFGDVNDDDAITVSAAGVLTEGGAVTLTASAAIFAAGHVGGRIRIEARDFAAIKAWQEGIDGITIGTFRRSEGRVYEAASAGRTGYEQPVHVEGSEWDGDATGQDINAKGPYGVLWSYAYDRFGIVKITGFTSATQATGTVERTLPASLATTASPLWAFGLFSAEEGWPEHVWLWRGRLWYIRDFELAGSVAGSYRDFNEYDASGERQTDMGIRLRMDITDKVLWVRADRDTVILGTARGEYAIKAINPSEGISSSNLKIEPQRRHGSAEVWPIEAGGETFFVQRGGKKVRATAYEFSEDRYTGRWANVYARHVSRSGIVELGYQAEPEELVYALRADGTMAAHGYSPEQEVKGWSTAVEIEDAQILSRTEIPSPDGALDDMWLLVDRAGVRSLEQLGDWWDDEDPPALEDAMFLDSALLYDGAATTSFAGVDHLAGETVPVLADGVEQLVEVQGDGTFELEAAASKVLIGRYYTARLVPLAPAIELRDGTAMGRLRKTIGMSLYVLDSAMVKLGRLGAAALSLVFPWTATTPMSGPPLQSGWSEPKMPGLSPGRNERETIEDRSAYPLVLPAIVREVDVG